MPEDKIPDNFIDRQLRESQYIARKAREILQTICYNVWATSGTITAELRHLWGWDEITMNLQFEKYKQLGLTEEWWNGKASTVKTNIKKKLFPDGQNVTITAIMPLMHLQLPVPNRDISNALIR
ncbi:MAG: hypothetical protein QM800_11710 [Paludibacter sp.]